VIALQGIFFRQAWKSC